MNISILAADVRAKDLERDQIAEALAAPAAQGEPVYLYRRLGLDDFVTCDFTRYTELSGKPNLFETKILYAAPQPAELPANLKDIVTSFYYWWHNQPGSNTADGYDEWISSPNIQRMFATRQPVEQQPDPTDMQILAITTAYEQGVGKGHDAHHRGVEIQNPYGASWGCDKAWQMGYEEGKEQVAQPQPAPDVEALAEALEELVDLIEYVRQGEYYPDSFTTQPARIALAAHRKQGGAV